MPKTVAAYDKNAANFDKAQYDAGVGPCLSAAVTGQTEQVPNISEALTRACRKAAAAADIGAALSVPLTAPPVVAGSLNCFALTSQQPAWADDVVEAAELLAAHADDALTVANRMHETKQWELYFAAAADRRMIDHAVGILMGRRRCDAQRAFAVLEATAREAGAPMGLVAQKFVQGFADRIGGIGANDPVVNLLLRQAVRSGRPDPG